MIENYRAKFTARGKYIFEPNDECRRRGESLIKLASHIDLPDYFFHYRSGGHVAALHRHIEHTHYFRIDLKNFFYSLSRNRVSAVLRQSKIPDARTFAEWSCVRNPYPDGPSYVLPIGFKQSPLLASLALWRSAVASAVEDALRRDVFVSVYFDDLIGSSNDLDQLRVTYDGIRAACVQANLIVNPTKLAEPADAIVAFNCHLSFGRAEVTEERITKFVETNPGERAVQSFIDYCARVQLRNFAA
jgi:hypothetical protein